MALTSSTLTAGSSTVNDATADRAELTQDKSTDSTLLARGVQDRVARDSERVRVDAVTGENAKRAATEAALAANDAPLQVSLVGAPGSNSPRPPPASRPPASDPSRGSTRSAVITP